MAPVMSREFWDSSGTFLLVHQHNPQDFNQSEHPSIQVGFLKKSIYKTGVKEMDRWQITLAVAGVRVLFSVRE